jgi:ribose transport system substrate-binding protein
MSKILKAIAAATLLVVAGLASAGASAADADRLRGAVEPVVAKKPYRIGVTVVHFVDDYWKGIAYGLTEESKEANVQIVRLLGAGGYGKVAEQIAQIETLSALNLDAVILGATSFNGYDRAIQRLTDKGVKVIAAGVPVNSKLVSLGVTMDEIAIGKTIAGFVCKQKADAKVATIPGPNGPAWNKLRFDGVQAGAKDCPGMQLLGNTFQGDTKIEDGEAQASDLLVKYPDANYIYAAAANLGTGAALAAKRMNRPAQVVTATVTAKTVDLMKEGRIAMVVSEPGILIGRSLIQYTTRLLNGDPLPNLVEGGPIPYKQFLVPLYELTPQNIGAYDLTKFDQPPAGWQVPNVQ